MIHFAGIRDENRECSTSFEWHAKSSKEGENMATTVPQLRTPGVIADELSAPLSRVLYILRKHNIRPIGRAGVLRLFDRSAVDAVRDALHTMDCRPTSC